MSEQKQNRREFFGMLGGIVAALGLVKAAPAVLAETMPDKTLPTGMRYLIDYPMPKYPGRERSRIFLNPLCPPDKVYFVNLKDFQRPPVEDFYGYTGGHPFRLENLTK